jgi:hypothetical protein
MKSICLVLLVVSLAFAADTQQSQQSQVSAENFKSDVKEVDIQKLATTWFVIFSFQIVFYLVFSPCSSLCSSSPLMFSSLILCSLLLSFSPLLCSALSLSSLPRYQVGGTKDLQALLKGCSCNTLTFSKIPNNEHKLLGVSTCKNASTNAMKSVNGTLTRVGKGNANAFRIEFIETDIKPIKKEISEEEASKIKPIKEDIGMPPLLLTLLVRRLLWSSLLIDCGFLLFSGTEHKKEDDSKKDDASRQKLEDSKNDASKKDDASRQKLEDSSKADASKKDDASKTQKLEEAHTPNAFIGKLDSNYKHFALVTPNIKSAVILSQDKTMDDNTMKSYTDYLSSKGFSDIAKIDQSAC